MSSISERESAKRKESQLADIKLKKEIKESGRAANEEEDIEPGEKVFPVGINANRIINPMPELAKRLKEEEEKKSREDEEAARIKKHLDDHGCSQCGSEKKFPRCRCARIAADVVHGRKF